MPSSRDRERAAALADKYCTKDGAPLDKPAPFKPAVDPNFDEPVPGRALREIGSDGPYTHVEHGEMWLKSVDLSEVHISRMVEQMRAMQTMAMRRTPDPVPMPIYEALAGFKPKPTETFDVDRALKAIAAEVDSEVLRKRLMHEDRARRTRFEADIDPTKRRV